MNCTLALRVLDAWIDGELDPATAAQMSEHVAGCRGCAAAHAQRVALGAALRSPALRYTAPPGLRAEIRAEIGSPVGAAPPAFAARALRWWQALALAGATAALGALGGWWWAQPAADGLLPELAVARHVASLTPAGPRVDIASSDRHVVRPWFQGRLEFAPAVHDVSAQGFELAGARLDRLGDRQAVAIVYRLHAHVINLFTWRGGGAEAVSSRAATVHGFNVLAWSDGDMNYAAVSDADGAELQRFATAYRAP